MEKQIKRRVYIFIFIAIACGWIGKSVDMILTKQPKGQSLGSLIWLITPMIASFILARGHNSTWKKLGIRLNIKGKGKWFLLSAILFPMSSAVFIILGICLGVVNYSSFNLLGFIETLMAWFVYNFFRTILEESAWRGFLTERLFVLNVNDWLIYLITGLVWSTWHIPYYLFFYHSPNSWQMIISSFVILFSWSILYTEIYRITECIWPCILLHATANAIQYTLLEKYFVMSDKWKFYISPINGFAACAICIVVGFLVRKYRIEHEKKQSAKIANFPM